MDGGGAGAEGTAVGEQPGRSHGMPVETRVVLRYLLGEVHVQRPPAASSPVGDRADLVVRHRPYRVHGRTDHHVVGPRHLLGSDQLVDPRRPAARVAVAVAHLHALRLLAEAAGEVAGVEQGDPDAGVARGTHQGEAHLVGLVVRRAVGLVVQVVELAHGGDAGREHLAVRRPGQGVVGVGVEPAGDLVHPVAPGPERPAPALRVAAERAVEGVAVAVRETGDRQACKVIGTGSTDLDPGEATALDLDQHVVLDRTVDVRTLQEVRGGVHPASSRRVVARASTPARQSAIGACSSGEWLTPAGLRTNSMAVGIPAAERIPAS